MPVSIEVWGEWACFTRPELKTERVSYDIMTPSAARGILDAIFFHPGMRWVVDRITVCKDIQFMNIRRNEISETLNTSTSRTALSKQKGALYIAASDCIQQRSTMALRNVHYIIDAHFTMTDKAAPSDNEGKFQDQIKRRLAKGRCFHNPYLGIREFAAHFAPCQTRPPCPNSLLGKKDLGWMLLDMDYSDPQNIQPMFFRAILHNGILEVPKFDSPEVKR